MLTCQLTHTEMHPFILFTYLTKRALRYFIEPNVGSPYCQVLSKDLIHKKTCQKLRNPHPPGSNPQKDLQEIYNPPHFKVLYLSLIISTIREPVLPDACT